MKVNLVFSSLTLSSNVMLMSLSLFLISLICRLFSSSRCSPFFSPFFTSLSRYLLLSPSNAWPEHPSHSLPMGVRTTHPMQFQPLPFLPLTISTFRNFDLNQFWLLDLSYIIITSGFIFSRRFSREKCPTLTVASFFFVRPQTSSRMYHFLQTSLSITCTRQYSVYGESSGHGFESLL